MGEKRSLEQDVDSEAGQARKRAATQEQAQARLHNGAMFHKHMPSSQADPLGSSNEDSSTARAKLQKLYEALDKVFKDPTALRKCSEEAGDEYSKSIERLHGGLQAISSTSRSLPSSSRVQVPGQVTKPPSESTEIPPLPPVHDEHLRTAVFTHGGFSSNETSYEQLEFVGDAYLECIATRLIYARFPKVAVGRLAQMREALINNHSLAELSRHYGFPERVRVPAAIDVYGKPGTKVQADVFEAYVAAIILQDPDAGFATAEAWLAALWAPKLGEYEREPEINHMAKQDLMRLIMGKGIRVEYLDSRRPEKSSEHKGKTSFFVSVYLTGWGWDRQLLGSGTDWSKGAAGTRAAMDALANEKLIGKITAVKRAFDAAVNAEKEGQKVEANQ